jgi:hypothetical protein
MEEWINVNDRLPTCDEQHNKIFSSGKVLVWTWEGCDIDEYLKYYESTSKGYVLIKENWSSIEGITHWMGLPKGPK